MISNPAAAGLRACSISTTIRSKSNRVPISLAFAAGSAVRYYRTYRMSRTTTAYSKLIRRLAAAALVGDQTKLQVAITSAIKALKADDPELSKDLAHLLSQYLTNPASLRDSELGPPPVDSEEGLALVRGFPSEVVEPPVLEGVAWERVSQFIIERHGSHRLFSEGFSPAASILMIGAPGTGKTMLARWLAQELGLPFVVQDLATSISSLLGKTGLNLRRTLDYARRYPCVLLLDEFDAIAKRRDDKSELGELKRIVNVLLKELEEWPEHSVLIAATNHPELLDPAIARRFHLVLHLELPGISERAAILGRAAGRFSIELGDEFLLACAEVLRGKSGSDVTTLMTAAVRRHLTSEQSLHECVLAQLAADVGGKRLAGPVAGQLLRALRVSGGKKAMTVRQLADLFGKTPSTIQHHLKKGD